MNSVTISEQRYDILRAHERALAVLEASNTWVATEQTCPDASGPVLVRSSDGGICLATFLLDESREAFFQVRRGSFHHVPSGAEIVNVTHWRFPPPLPPDDEGGKADTP